MKFLGGCLAFLVIAAGVTALEAWVIMLVMGALHHEVDARIPALGWTASFWVAVALTILGSFFKSSITSGGGK